MTPLISRLATKRKDFDYLDYFLRDPRFARFFSQYEKLAVITRYTLYRRR